MDGIETATGDKPMQDIATDLEARLFGGEENEPEEIQDEEVSGDAEELPADDDSDSEDEDGSDDLDDIAEDDDIDLSLADYLGVEDDRVKVGEDGSVSLETIVDGEKKDVPLKDLVSSYQLQGHVNNKSISLENERKEFGEQQKAVANDLKQRSEQLEVIGKVLEDQLVEEYNSIDWDRLRAENPSEWGAMRQEYAERAQRVQQAQGAIAGENERLAQESMQKNQMAMQEYAKGQVDRLIAQNPEWSDETKRNEGLANIRSFLSDSYGFSKDDMLQVTDYRLINIIKDAQKFRAGTKVVEEKKQKKVPKFKKPGAAKANREQLSKARDTKVKRAKVKSSGKTADVADLILSRM